MGFPSGKHPPYSVLWATLLSREPCHHCGNPVATTREVLLHDGLWANLAYQSDKSTFMSMLAFPHGGIEAAGSLSVRTA